MSPKERYRAFSAREPSLPIFSRDWWLDASAGFDNWDVALVEKGGEVVAAMPYTIRKRFGLTIVGQPQLTQKLGPWFAPFDGKPATRLAREKTLMQQLIDQLPAFDHFSQNWHYQYTNWLPFCWNGFRQTTRYTYLLPGPLDPDKVWAGFENTARADCKKAMERHRLHVTDQLSLDEFLELNAMTFQRQGMAMPYDEGLARRIDAECAARGCRKILVAVDDDGRRYAGNYMVWDENSSYGLMSGIHLDARNSGAATLCMWEAIRHASTVTRQFDFTGSMMEPVERFFRGFGAVQVPYSNISKTPSRLLEIRRRCIEIVRGEPPHQASFAS